jgi:hypothetical protein
MQYILLICLPLLFSSGLALDVNFADNGTCIEPLTLYQVTYQSFSVHQDRNQISRRKSDIVLQWFGSWRGTGLVPQPIAGKFCNNLGRFHRLLVLGWRFAIQCRSKSSTTFSAWS